MLITQHIPEQNQTETSAFKNVRGLTAFYVTSHTDSEGELGV